MPPLLIATDWATYLTGSGATLLVQDSSGTAGVLTNYGFATGLTLPTSTSTGQARTGTKEWSYCSGRGRCNQVNGAIAVTVVGLVFFHAPSDCLQAVLIVV